MQDKLIAANKTSKRGPPLRITPLKEIAEKLNVSEPEHVGFYEVNGEIVVRRLSNSVFFLITILILGNHQKLTV